MSTRPARIVALAVAAAFTLGGLTVASAQAAPPVPTCPVYADVPTSNQFRAAICWMAGYKITYGTSATTYSPGSPVTRGQMAAFLYRLAGSPKWSGPAVSPYADVPTSHQFYNAITWLAHENITYGTGKNAAGQDLYSPGRTVTRGQMAAFLNRIANWPGAPKGYANPFADLTRDNQFYGSILWLASTKITVGSTVGGKTVYLSGSAVTRGSMAAFIKRLALTKAHCVRFPGGVGCGPDGAPQPTEVTPPLVNGGKSPNHCPTGSTATVNPQTGVWSCGPVVGANAPIKCPAGQYAYDANPFAGATDWKCRVDDSREGPGMLSCGHNGGSTRLLEVKGWDSLEGALSYAKQQGFTSCSVWGAWKG